MAASQTAPRMETCWTTSTGEVNQGLFQSRRWQDHLVDLSSSTEGGNFGFTSQLNFLHFFLSRQSLKLKMPFTFRYHLFASLIPTDPMPVETFSCLIEMQGKYFKHREAIWNFFFKKRNVALFSEGVHTHFF